MMKSVGTKSVGTKSVGLSLAVLAAVAGVLGGRASAHGYSGLPPVVTARSPGVHVSRGAAGYRGGVVVVGLPGQLAAARTTYRLSEITVFAVPSDAARYRAATGLALPARHGIIALRPATARGDVTYLWASPSE